MGLAPSLSFIYIIFERPCLAILSCIATIALASETTQTSVFMRHNPFLKHGARPPPSLFIYAISELTSLAVLSSIAAITYALKVNTGVSLWYTHSIVETWVRLTGSQGCKELKVNMLNHQALVCIQARKKATIQYLWRLLMAFISRDLARISKLPVFLNSSTRPKLSKMAKMA